MFYSKYVRSFLIFAPWAKKIAGIWSMRPSTTYIWHLMMIYPCFQWQALFSCETTPCMRGQRSRLNKYTIPLSSSRSPIWIQDKIIKYLELQLPKIISYIRWLDLSEGFQNKPQWAIPQCQTRMMVVQAGGAWAYGGHQWYLIVFVHQCLQNDW